VLVWKQLRGSEAALVKGMCVMIDWVLVLVCTTLVLFAHFQLGKVLNHGGYQGFCGQLCQHERLDHTWDIQACSLP